MKTALRLCIAFVTICVAATHGSAAVVRDDDTPPADRFTFPPQWEPQEAVWIGWSYDPSHHPVQIEMIRALVPSIPVRLFVFSDEVREQARASIDAAGVPVDRVEFVSFPIPNPWTRDPGPIFLSDGRRLAVAQFAWSWYGYPKRHTVNWPSPETVGQWVAQEYDLPLIRSELVAEGGGIEVSSSVLLTYRDVALQRNPGVPLEKIEAEYLRMYGKEKVIWLSRSPVSDRVTDGPKIENFVGWGANGHIDEYIRFVNDRTIVIASIDPDERDDNALVRADYEILKENLAELRDAVNVDGKPFEIVTLPVPTLRHFMITRAITEEDKQNDLGRIMLESFEVGDEVHFVPALSYLNFFISNDVVLVPAYWQEGLPESEKKKDEQVRTTMQRLFPDRQIIQINPLAINWGGGGMHCMTQQQPRLVVVD
jgi:agmatine deiminase